jgi:hypothetical protein
MQDLINKFSSNSMNTKTIYIKKKFLFDEEILNSLRLMPHFYDHNDETASSLCNQYLNTIYSKINDVMLNAEKFSLNNKNILLSMLSTHFSSSKSSLFLKKSSLLLTIEFLRKDKFEQFSIIYDFILKLSVAFQNKSLDFYAFNFFKDLETLLKSRYFNNQEHEQIL